MQPYDIDYNLLPNNQTRPTGSKLIILACVLAVLVAAGIVLSATIKKSASSTLDVTVSDQSAKISVIQANHETKLIGQGNQHLLLKPGNYMINAKTDTAETTRAITVDKDQQNSISLNLRDQQTPKALAEYTAQDIFVKDKTLYFLNLPFKVLNSFTPGDFRVSSYAPSIYPVSKASWIDRQHLYAQTGSKDWLYVDNSVPDLLVSNAKLLDPDYGISFNNRGGYAYIDKDQNVITATSPTSKSALVAKSVGAYSRVSIASNGNVLFYSPDQPYATDIKPTQLYDKSNNRIKSMPDSLKGIDHVVWSPSSTAFSYTLKTGIYTYEPSNQSSQQLTVSSPSRPLSVAWAGETSVLYAENDAIWKYDTSDQTSSKLSSVTGIFGDSQVIYVNDTGTAAYFGTVPQSGKGGNIYSIGLQK